MENIKVLDYDWGYPVINHSKELVANIRIIISYINSSRYKDITFVGIGTSGAFLLSAIAALTAPPLFPLVYEQAKLRFVLLRKDNDDTRQGNFYTGVSKESKIVVVDDHIHNGYSMEQIHKSLRNQGVHENVELVISQVFYEYSNHAEKDFRLRDEVDKISSMLVKFFPNVKFWMY